ncbi:MAG: RT0821/Lpp0805 family surface protein [Rhizobiaceae bacterium]|nr:RT0821/Lpp0805 family surface protein [Rhizobiaceae bacterium]
MPGARPFGAALLLLSGLLSAGCTTSMIGLGSDKGVDSSTLTSTVAPADPNTDPETQSDALTVRNAISSADLTSLEGSPLAWANADTGSRGAISAVTEDNEQGVVCRKFKTTRERFDGIALYQGRACMIAPGMWQMTAFAPT